jgi:hypothetical protein
LDAITSRRRLVPTTSLTAAQILTMLAGTPPRIAVLTAGLPPDQLCATPPDGGWSADDVLAHMRSCADVWGDCIAAIITQDTPTLRAVNPRSWI